MVAFNRLAGYRSVQEQALAEYHWTPTMDRPELPKAPPRKPDYRTSDLRVLWFVSLIAVGVLAYGAGVNR